MESDIRSFVASFLRGRGLDWARAELLPIGSGGSERSFWRLILDSGQLPSMVVMANPPVDRRKEAENKSYLMIGRHLKSKMLPVPEFYFYDLEKGCFVVEDLGEKSLQEFAGSLRDPAPVYKAVLEELFRFQVEGAKGFDPVWCCQTARYDLEVMKKYEADYFRDAFLKGFLGLNGPWEDLERVFDDIAKEALKAEGGFFMHRDFQSSNIVVGKDKIGFVDWQGGRLGPLAYDVASLLLDPYVQLSEGTKQELWDHYFFCVGSHSPEQAEDLKRCYPYIAIQRSMQILGAFGYLSKFMKKPRFRSYIPGALENFHSLVCRIEEEDRRLTPLKDLLAGIRFEKGLDMKESGP